MEPAVYDQPRHPRRSRRPAPDEKQAVPFLVQMTDLGLVAAFFSVAFLWGGRQALGQFALVCCASWVALAWSAHQLTTARPSLRFSGAEPLFLAAIGLVTFQFIQLPPELVDSISPKIAEFLPIWSGEAAAMPVWNQLSLAPEATRGGLATLLSYAIIFCVVMQRVRTVSDVERILRWCAVVSVAMAVFGLVQFLAGNGKFYWIYEHPLTNTEKIPKGSFTNRNHFGQFMALGIAPLLWWMISTLNQRSAGFRSGSGGARGGNELLIGTLLLAVGTVAFAELLSLSRGGMVAMFAAALVCLSMLCARGLVSGKLIVALLSVAALVGGGLAIFGLESVADRLENMDSGRTRIWKANVEIIKDFPLVGTGTGSHAEAYKAYLDQPFETKEFTHPESSMFQVASENGLVGFGLAMLGVLTCTFWVWRGARRSESKRLSMAMAGVGGSLAANFVHAPFDVVWYTPGCMVIVVALAACACRLCQLSKLTKSSPASAADAPSASRVLWLGSFGGALALAAWMLMLKLPPVLAEPHWHEYLRYALAKPETDADALDEAESDEEFRQKLVCLQKAAIADPNNARIQALMATGYVALFQKQQSESENAMKIAQIRDAALASEFPSQEAKDEWLDRVLGKNRRFLDAALAYAKRGATLCPMQGRAYLDLADLKCLESGDLEIAQRFIAQALTVRPYDARVLFTAGREAWAAGDADAARVHWVGAFHRNYQHQTFIISAMAPSAPAQAVIETFQPDWKALKQITEFYKTLERPIDYGFALQTFAAASEAKAQEAEGATAADYWVHAGRSYDAIRNTAKAQACLQSAVSADPQSFEARSALGRWLLANGNATDALEHLAWCNSRKPNDDTFKTLVDRATRASQQSPIMPASYEFSMPQPVQRR